MKRSLWLMLGIGLILLLVVGALLDRWRNQQTPGRWLHTDRTTSTMANTPPQRTMDTSNEVSSPSASLPTDAKGRTPNRLLHEKSPYLLQHAYNPVDWYPWGPEAFAKAKGSLRNNWHK